MDNQYQINIKLREKETEKFAKNRWKKKEKMQERKIQPKLKKKKKKECNPNYTNIKHIYTDILAGNFILIFNVKAMWHYHFMPSMSPCSLPD